MVRVHLVLLALLVNKVLLELLDLLAQEVPLALLVSLAKMVSMVCPVLLDHLAHVVVMVMLVQLVPLVLLVCPDLLAHPAVALTSSSSLNLLKRNPTMVAVTTEPMTPMSCATVTWRLTPL